MIDQVLKYGNIENPLVMVFDEKGEQIPVYQGRYEDVKAKILAHAPKSAKFFHGFLDVAWGFGEAVPRKEW